MAEVWLKEDAKVLDKIALLTESGTIFLDGLPLTLPLPGAVLYYNKKTAGRYIELTELFRVERTEVPEIPDELIQEVKCKLDAVIVRKSRLAPHLTEDSILGTYNHNGVRLRLQADRSGPGRRGFAGMSPLKIASIAGGIKGGYYTKRYDEFIEGCWAVGSAPTLTALLDTFELILQGELKPEKDE